MSAGHLTTGRAGEEVATRFLRQKGWQIRECNFRCRDGELDIIAHDGEMLVFVEVKTRSGTMHGQPGEAVGRTKQTRLIKAASRYLSQKNLWSMGCRFDLVTVLFHNNQMDVEHWENVIDVRNALGRGHPAWQPW